MDKTKRKAIEKGILEFTGKITPGGASRRVYESIFKKCTDEQFKSIWDGIKTKGYIPIFLDNFDSQEMIDYDLIVNLAKEWNIPLEQQVIIPDSDTGIFHTTPETALVGIVEVGKQRQIIVKKIGVSKHDYDIEDLTGQPTGDSKAGGISNPEINILIALGLPTVAKELASVKGGDIGAYRNYKSQLSMTGHANTKEALKNGTGVKSLQTANWLLRGRHIISTIGER